MSTGASLQAVILSFGHDSRYAGLLQLVVDTLGPESVVVAHNPYGPEDDWRPELADGVELVVMHDNVGYAQAMNAGLALLDGDWAILLTHDCELDASLLEGIRRHCSTLPSDVGVAGPVLRLPDGRRTYGSDMRPDGWVGRLYAPPVDGVVVDVPFVDGSAMVVRRSMIEDVGVLWPDYFMYFEEADLSDRARSRGWRTVVLTDLELASTPGGAGRPAAYGFLYARNGFDWALRNRGPAAARGFRRAQLRQVRHTAPRATDLIRRPKSVARLQLISMGRLVGLAAAACGRTRGRPPRYLTRASDIVPS